MNYPMIHCATMCPEICMGCIEILYCTLLAGRHENTSVRS